MSKAKDLAGLVSTGSILADGSVNLASEVNGTLPVANGGTGTTSTTFANLTTNVTGTLPIGNGGTNATTADGALTALGGTATGTNVFKAVDAAAARAALGAGVGDVTTTGTQTLTNKTLSGADNTLTVDGTDAVGFRNVPVNSQSAAYTLVLADAGKVIFHPASDNNARTFTIPAASSVAYPIGTALTFINLAATASTIAITTDTMYLSSAGTTGSRTLAQYGSATAIKVSGLSSSGVWIISGSGLT